VPLTLETVTSTEDVVLQYGERAVLQPLGAGIVPSGAPTIIGGDDAQAHLSSDDFLQDIAREKYTEDIFVPNTHTYTIALSKSKSVILPYFWCATTDEILAKNFQSMTLNFIVDGQEIPADQLATYDVKSGDLSCRIIYVALTEWPGGEHHLSITTTFNTTINDGANDYAPGDYVMEFAVYIKP
jgi:hypothetical protein